MTVEEIVTELKALQKRWADHVEYCESNEPEDWGWSRGKEDGYEQAADELGDLISEIGE